MHNYYQQAGGEDRVVALETELLRSYGHQVICYSVHNQQLVSLWQKLALVFNCIFSIRHYRRFRQLLLQEQPDVVHVHNYFPMLSPAIFYAAKSAGVPVVHTLHNFRAICPSATLFDGTQVNTQSLQQSPFWTVRKKIYRQSSMATLLVYLMVIVHRRFGTWQKQVDQFITLSDTSQQLYTAAGWPTDKLVVKANFIAPLQPSLLEAENQRTENSRERKAVVLYVGRLATEKGVSLMLQAWSTLQVPLWLVGTGPLQAKVDAASRQSHVIQPFGAQPAAMVQDLMQQAALLVVPSLCIETFGLVVLEAFRQRLPVLVAGHGALADLVQHGVNGWHFKAGDPDDLVLQIERLMQDPKLRQQLGDAGWQTEQQCYQPAQNYQQLIQIYQQATKLATLREQG